MKREKTKKRARVKIEPSPRGEVGCLIRRGLGHMNSSLGQEIEKKRKDGIGRLEIAECVGFLLIWIYYTTNLYDDHCSNLVFVALRLLDFRLFYPVPLHFSRVEMITLSSVPS